MTISTASILFTGCLPWAIWVCNIVYVLTFESPKQLPKTAECNATGIFAGTALAAPVLIIQFVVPKFKTIFTDMLGEGEALPEFTQLVFAVSDAFKNNWGVFIPVLVGFAWFIGHKRRFFSKVDVRINRCLVLMQLAQSWASYGCRNVSSFDQDDG